MDWSSGLVLVWLSLRCITLGYGYKVGVGIADITGPPAEVAFMGYANPAQRGAGLHLRQFSRAFIIDDGSSRMVFVSADCGMMGTFLRKEILRRLEGKLGDLYTIDNVMISGTHTHSTPGGFLMDILFDLNSWGFVSETFEAYASGITRSILRAHGRMVQGDVEYARGEVQMANINRSPTSYLRNPEDERSRYKYDVDKTFSQLKFFRKDGFPLGVITWFAVHPTSMNNSNLLVSSDNVGLASIMFEQRVNKEYTNLIGKEI
nr:neutral ceramidase [Halyomorpha halys]